MFECRVTKYDPQFRDATGTYTRSEWTRFSDIGRLVAADDYLRIETGYLNVATAFLSEAGIDSLQIRGFENPRSTPVSYADGTSLAPDQWEAAFRSVLREEFWCRFESVSGFVHFGWDYYMYIGVLEPCPDAKAVAAVHGLFVEDCPSPYKVAG